MKQLDIEKIKNDLRSQFHSFAHEIAPVYKELNWKWAMRGIPTEFDIIKALEELTSHIQEVDLSQDFPMHTITSGGLTVGYEVYKIDGSLNSIELILNFKFDRDIASEIIDYMKEV